MRTISLRLSHSLHRQLRALAAREGISFNELVALTLAEKVHAVRCEEDPALRPAEDAVDIRDAFPDIDWRDASPRDDAPDA